MKVSEEAYKFFCNRVKYWQRELGLLDWKICFVQDDQMPDNGIACINSRPFDRIAQVRLCTIYPIGTTEEEYELDIHAFHETCHILLAELDMYACKSEGVHKDTIYGEVHGIVRRLEHLMADKFISRPGRVVAQMKM